MRRELRDALDILMEVFEEEDLTLAEMKSEAENHLEKVLDVINDIEHDTNSVIKNLGGSPIFADVTYDLEQIAEKLY